MGNDQIITSDIARALQTDIAWTHSLFGWAIWRDGPDYPGKVSGRLLTYTRPLYGRVAQRDFTSRLSRNGT